MNKIPSYDCTCYKVDITSNGSSFLAENITGNINYTSLRGDSACESSQYGTLFYSISGYTTSCDNELSGTFKVFQVISDGPIAYEYTFNLDGSAISSSWGIATLYPQQECLDIDAPEPVVVITRSTAC